MTDIIPGRSDRLLVLGAARSGTRWLATALGQAEGTRLVKEPDNVDADPRGHGPGRLGFGPYPLLDPDERAPQFRALWDLSFAARFPNDRAGEHGVRARRCISRARCAIRCSVARRRRSQRFPVERRTWS